MGILICQGGLTSPGFFGLAYFIGTLGIVFFRGGSVELKDMAYLIIISLFITVLRMFF